MKRKISFSLKLAFWFVLLSVLISSSMVYVIHVRALSAQKEELRKKLTAVATTGAIFIDSGLVASIPVKPEGENTKEYAQLKELLKKIQGVDRGVRFVYVMVKSETPFIWKFIADSETNPRYKSGTGTNYSVENRPQMKLAFEGPIADENLETDRWGTWLSAYAPIKDKNGNAVAILGVDYSAKSFADLQRYIKERTALVIMVALLLSIALGFAVAKSVTAPISKLVNAMKKVALGDFKQTVDIKTNDEIEDAAGIFNHMAKELAHLYKNLQDHFLSTIFSFVSAIEAKDSYTKGHSERVSAVAVKIAEEMGLVQEEIDIIKTIGVLHDIGKIGISENILRKPGKLTESEMEAIRTHPEVGESILKSVEMLRPGLSIVKSHHERPDGKGYPEGLTEKHIPLLAAIVAVADSYDAMVSERPYRAPLTKDEAIAQIKKNSGTQFIPNIVDAFVRMMEKQR